MSDQAPPEAPAPTAKSTRKKPVCAICGKEASKPRAFGMVRPAIAQTMLADHPDLHADSIICSKHAAPYRTQYVTDLLARRAQRVPTHALLGSKHRRAPTAWKHFREP